MSDELHETSVTVTVKHRFAIGETVRGPGNERYVITGVSARRDGNYYDMLRERNDSTLQRDITYVDRFYVASPPVPEVTYTIMIEQYGIDMIFDQTVPTSTQKLINTLASQFKGKAVIKAEIVSRRPKDDTLTSRTLTAK